MSVADTAREIGLSELMIYQTIESGDLHFVREANVNILVCLNSLRHNQRRLEEGSTTHEQNGEGESQGTQE